jgi:carbon storage regulator
VCPHFPDKITLQEGPSLDWTRCISKATNEERTFGVAGNAPLRFGWIPHSILKSRSEQMLILSRKKSERIVIDGGVTVKVIAVKGNVVQLGIAAPKEIPIHRNEICSKIQKPVPDLPVHQQ